MIWKTVSLPLEVLFIHSFQCKKKKQFYFFWSDRQPQYWLICTCSLFHHNLMRREKIERIFPSSLMNSLKIIRFYFVRVFLQLHRLLWTKVFSGQNGSKHNLWHWWNENDRFLSATLTVSMETLKMFQHFLSRPFAFDTNARFVSSVFWINKNIQMKIQFSRHFVPSRSLISQSMIQMNTNFRPNK